MPDATTIIHIFTTVILLVFVLVQFFGVVSPSKAKFGKFELSGDDDALTIDYNGDATKKWTFTKDGHITAQGNMTATGNVQGATVKGTTAVEGATVKVGGYFTMKKTTGGTTAAPTYKLQVSNGASTVETKSVAVIDDDTAATLAVALFR